MKSFLLSRITSAGIKKNQIKGILKVSYRFITSWQLHSNDFRLESAVDLNCFVLECPNSGQRLGKWAATTCAI